MFSLTPRGVVAQCPCLAGRTRLALLRVQFTGRDPVLEVRDLCLSLDDDGFLVFQRQFQVCRIQLLGFQPELSVPVMTAIGSRPALRLRKRRGRRRVSMMDGG